MNVNLSKKPLSSAVSARYESCLSCGSCRAVCPVQRSTGKLIPARQLRLASMGIGPSVSELWYCQQCNRCSAVCPVRTAPSQLISDLRKECFYRGILTLDQTEALGKLQEKLQQSRRTKIEAFLQGNESISFDKQRRAQADNSVIDENEYELNCTDADTAWNLSQCMACGSCTTVCPVAHDPAVYDPARLFRAVCVGRTDVLIRSASLWLCLGCGRCTEVCAQTVGGHRMIEAIQNKAIASGAVPADIREKLREIDYELLIGWTQDVRIVIEEGGRRIPLDDTSIKDSYRSVLPVSTGLLRNVIDSFVQD